MEHLITIPKRDLASLITVQLNGRSLWPDKFARPRHRLKRALNLPFLSFTLGRLHSFYIATLLTHKGLVMAL